VCVFVCLCVFVCVLKLSAVASHGRRFGLALTLNGDRVLVKFTRWVLVCTPKSNFDKLDFLTSAYAGMRCWQAHAGRCQGNKSAYEAGP
jgi:hypothetical protein